MNMNKIVKYTAVAALGLASACSLDSESMTAIDNQTYYRTEADAAAALVGCYDGYQQTVVTSSMSFYMVSEMMGDDCFGGAGNGDARDNQIVDRFDISQAPGYTSLMANTWEEYYAAIFRCNSLIVNLDNIAWNSEESRQQTEGEVRFLRAIEYFDLVRLFGRIPLLTEPSKDCIPQSEPAETFKVIVDDLKFAAENIQQPWTIATDGRATAAAAKAMLARVYLFYTGYYGAELENVTKTEVVEGLEDIIADATYDLVPDFKNLWRAACATPNFETQSLDDNDWVGRACQNFGGKTEFIFTQKFNNTGNYDGDVDGNLWLVNLGLRSVKTAGSVPYAAGWGLCTVNPDSYKLFDANDPRRSASIVDVSTEGNEKGTLKADVEANSISDWREYTGYVNKKYIPLSYPVVGADGTWSASQEVIAADMGAAHQIVSQYQDYVVMRYADVLLMHSELTENADGMNLVRARAGLTAIGYSKEALLEERHRELMFEGVRYWDLLRQGIDYAAEKIAGQWSVTSGGNPDTVVISADNIKKTKGLCQIPLSQITLSGNVYTQNEGWN